MGAEQHVVAHAQLRRYLSAPGMSASPAAAIARAFDRLDTLGGQPDGADRGRIVPLSAHWP
jgi:hypothetical protein